MLQKLSQKDFDKVYKIMEDAFPFDERRSYEEQKALLANSKYSIYGIKNAENQEIKAFITIYSLDDFAFIEHFAVSAEYRNNGLGSLILRELSDLLQCNICFEVELPNTEFAKKRIEFYKRNGFYVNNFPYIQPPMSKDKKQIPLLIMTSGGTVTNSEFEKIKDILYKNVYGINVL